MPHGLNFRYILASVSVFFYIPGAVGEMLSGITPLRFVKTCIVVHDISIPGPPGIFLCWAGLWTGGASIWLGL
jgi:hypothetical protein